MEEPKRVLYVNSEIFPYMPESDISTIGRFLPQGVQETGKEIRSFMPRYGVINERRNQLHEVIRLSGMNIVIGNADRPLVIKVSSISCARMQVYFIDNEDYFHRKAVYTDQDGEYFKDNDERAVFFARGVLETVKKLRWKPDIVHCQGWISHVFPILLKKAYHEDPIFTDAKVVLSLYNDGLDMTFRDDMAQKIQYGNITAADTAVLSPANGINLAKLAVQYSDGIIEGTPATDPQIAAFAREKGIPVLPYVAAGAQDTAFIAAYNSFYDKISENETK